MPYVGPYQQYVIASAENVARVEDWAKQAAGITAGIEQGKGEAVEEAALAAAEKDAKTLEAARQFTTDTLNTSHLDLDVDGTPYFKRGSMTLGIFADTDGNPFFIEN